MATYEDALKARARIAYQQNALTKMAFQTKKAAEADPDPDKQQKIDSYTNAVRRGATLANTAKAVDAANKADQKMQDDLQMAQYANDMAENWDKDYVNPSPERRELLDMRNENSKPVVTNAGDAARKNMYYGAGAGILGGAGIGAAAYGIGGLFPSLKKRRLLRALIALTAGGAGGAGLGYLAYQGLQNGKVQKLVGQGKDLANKGVEKVKGVFSKGDKGAAEAAAK